MSASDREVFAPGVPVSELTYTEASQELDAIVEFFEQREVDVDQLVARLERATAIVDELDRRIRRTRAQVEELVPRLDAVSRGAEQPYEEDRGDEEPDGEAQHYGDHQDASEDEGLRDEAMAGEDLEGDLEVRDHGSDAARRPVSRSERDSPGEQPLF
jgi:exodeoxyribonuclease VII small subunit